VVSGEPMRPVGDGQVAHPLCQPFPDDATGDATVLDAAAALFAASMHVTEVPS
jgi:hypothetical protein